MDQGGGGGGEKRKRRLISVSSLSQHLFYFVSHHLIFSHSVPFFIPPSQHNMTPSQHATANMWIQAIVFYRPYTQDLDFLQALLLTA